MSKQIIYGADARAKAFKGVESLANAVKVTLGPSGKLVLLDKNDTVTATKDGVTVAEEISLKDPYENVGAKLVKEVASKTNSVAGDNTTTSTVLAYAMIKEGLKALSSGVAPLDIRNGMNKAMSDVTTNIEKMSKPVSSEEEIKNVATISANNDAEIGDLLAAAVNKVGKDGIITVVPSSDTKSSVELIEGLRFGSGWINPNFCNNRERMEANYEKACILITDMEIKAANEIMNVLEYCAQNSKPLLIVAKDVTSEALAALVLNSLRGTIKACAVKAPFFGSKQKDFLTDLAIVTGGQYLSSDLNSVIANNEASEILGMANCKITEDDTTITGFCGNKDDIAKHLETLRALAENSNGEEKNSVLKRIARIDSKVAQIKIGAATETELNEKKYRVEDTIAATRAALDKGILPGGGVALVNAGKNTDTSSLSAGEKMGYNICINALAEPLKAIAENAGVNGEVVLSNILKEKDGIGYNARTGEYKNMLEDGVIDTTKAITAALVNAVSAAIMFLTTECIVTDIPEEKSEPQLVAQPMMM